MRHLPVFLLLAALLPALYGDDRPVRLPSLAPVRATPIPLDLDDPTRRRIGGLEYEAGWVLHGTDPAFGGISAMEIMGDRFILLSDEGRLTTFTMHRDGMPGAARMWFVPGVGRRHDPRERDTEALTRDPATGVLWIGMEGKPALLRLDPGATRLIARRSPPAMRRWPRNGGAETLVRLRDGRFLVIAEEGSEHPGTRVALLFPGDPTQRGMPPIRFAYAPPMGFVPTDAAELPDGRIIVLNRHFAVRDGFAAAVTLFPAAKMRAGATIVPREIARLRRPLATDNMEAIAVTREPGGTMIWIASDDNLTLLQRTLLLKFRLRT